MSDSPDRTVYRTTDERNVSLWGKWQAENKKWNADREAFLAEWAPDSPGLMVDEFSGRRAVGVSVTGDPNSPPDGWRLDRKHWVFVPYRKTPRGKKIAKALDALRTPDLRRDLVGMPSSALISTRDGIAFCHPAIQMHGDAMFAIWSGEGPGEGEGSIDLTIWEPVKLSEWYAIQEAKEPAKGEQ